MLNNVSDFYRYDYFQSKFSFSQINIELLFFFLNLFLAALSLYCCFRLLYLLQAGAAL